MFDKLLGVPGPAVEMMLHKMGLNQRGVTPGADLERVLGDVNDAAFKAGSNINVIRGTVGGRAVILFAVIGPEQKP